MKIIPLTSPAALEKPEIVYSHLPALGQGRARYLRDLAKAHAPSLERLRKLRGIHKGRRAFIIGNAPSVARMDIQPLRSEVCFAVNSTFRLYPQLGFVFPYTCLSDRIRWFETGVEVLANSPGSHVFYCDDKEYPSPVQFFTADQLQMITLLSQSYRLPLWLHRWTPISNRAGLYTYACLLNKRFSWDVTKGISTGNSVIFMATQLAVWMGCNPVILIGVEMDYSGPTAHFHGQKIYTPPMNYETDAKPHFVRFRKDMESRGVKFLNATLGGKVDALERVDFALLF
jgi:hypothetical protein